MQPNMPDPEEGHRITIKTGPGVRMRIKHTATQFEFSFVREVEVGQEEACGQTPLKGVNRSANSLRYEPLASYSPRSNKLVRHPDTDSL